MVVVSLCLALLPSDSEAQATGGGQTSDAGSPNPEGEWSFRVSTSAYVVPDDDNFVQPTVVAERGALHLEGRYNYEDRHAVSGFAGWNIAFGSAFTVQLTPMFGAVIGDTDGIVPALELDLAWRRLELYVEGEYVFDLNNRSDRFLYSWSEASVWLTEWMRLGLVSQRTRVYRTPGDIQNGMVVGVSRSRVDAAVYLFNPGTDDHFVVASLGVTF